MMGTKCRWYDQVRSDPMIWCPENIKYTRWFGLVYSGCSNRFYVASISSKLSIIYIGTEAVENSKQEESTPISVHGPPKKRISFLEKSWGALDKNYIPICLVYHVLVCKSVLHNY
jgi:hypothetical protein